MRPHRILASFMVQESCAYLMSTAGTAIAFRDRVDRRQKDVPAPWAVLSKASIPHAEPSCTWVQASPPFSATCRRMLDLHTTGEV